MHSIDIVGTATGKVLATTISHILSRSTDIRLRSMRLGLQLLPQPSTISIPSATTSGLRPTPMEHPMGSMLRGRVDSLMYVFYLGKTV